MQGETILCISTRIWHSLWRDGQQIMSRIAKQNRVLFFEPGRAPDRSLLGEMRRNWPNFFALRTQELHKNLILIPTPPCLPYARRHLPRTVLRVTTPLVAKINARILARHIRWAMQAFHVEAPILWLYEPRHLDLVGAFGEKLACFFNYDEGSEFALNKRIKELLRVYDNRLSDRVDVIFATSRAQWQRRKTINPNTYFVPNGVDFEIFNRALTPDLPLPADIASVPHPIIGFAGWIGNHIDVELLLQVAKAYPSCSLVLVGPDYLPNTAGRQALRALPNVFFLGQKEPHELPHYLQAFDVALMPYGLSEHLRSAYPLKLHEYLAAGRAIVSTQMPELLPYSHLVRIADTYDQFIHQIRDALHDHSLQTIEARVAVARENTWDQRVEDIHRILQHHLTTGRGSLKSASSAREHQSTQ
jgi:glycosyltransferase involved in cell wall biosynthesis